MKVLILAAGLGTRLQHHTSDRPKAMVEVSGKPMIEHLITRLISQGVTEIIVNVHHFPDSIINFLHEKGNFGIRIEISDERDFLLDTGGGIKKAGWFFSDNKPFLVHNVDILTNLDLNRMLSAHKSSGAMATLAVRNRKTSRYFLFDNSNRLCGWKNESTGEIITSKSPDNLHKLAFSGIHIMEPAFLEQITQEGKFSITDTYVKQSGANKFLGFCHDETFWLDMGKPESIKAAESYLDSLAD